MQTCGPDPGFLASKKKGSEAEPKESEMRIGIIGAGQIGGTLTRRFTKLGHKVFVANSRGPESLADLAAETGAKAVTAEEAARTGDVVVVTIPEAKIRNLPEDLFEGVSKNVVIVDTGNYYPQQRDGRIEEIELGMPESRWVELQLGWPVVKAFNNIYAQHLMDLGRPAGAPGRIALPVAGDDRRAKGIIVELLNELGFDGVDAGGLDASWRQQPGTPVYGTDYDADGVRRALQAASPDRGPEWRGAASSPGSIAKPA
ncbi:MAG TPA: NAD(P)-binding domain-containing protein [Candidatus Acidoferrales bacterium]|nr:NAD(P)-binding domain-containing protein [Candidatus Acidoferrales bacterium]